jgi:hypothetical protein
VALAVLVTLWRPREGLCSPPAAQLEAQGRQACAEENGVWNATTKQCTCPV